MAAARPMPLPAPVMIAVGESGTYTPLHRIVACAHMALSHRFILAGKLTRSRLSDPVTDKYTGRTMARVAVPSRAHLEEAIAAGVQSGAAMRAMPAYQRGDV